MNKPDWENRNTESLSGWINELATLADHPQVREIWIRQAMGVIVRGLNRFVEPAQPAAAEVAPEWDGWCDAHRFLADIEIVQGGRNGPTIRLGGQLQKLRAQITEEKSADSQDAQRYRFLRMDAGIRNERPFIAISSAGGISQWTGVFADKQIDAALSGTGSDESGEGEA